MFETFWKHYPRKVAKRAALGAFNRLTRDEQAQAVEAIEQHLAYWKLKNTEIDYVPHASTWINQGRWEDILDMTPKQVKRPELPWYSSEELTIQKAQEINCPSYAGEGWQQWRSRISQKIKQLEEQL